MQLIYYNELGTFRYYAKIYIIYNNLNLIINQAS